MDLKTTPFHRVPVLEPDVRMEKHPDGTILLSSGAPLGARPHRMTERLLYWAEKSPDRVFLAQRDAGGEWQGVTYAQALDKARRIAGYLLEAGVSAERPLAILSENSVEHGLMALGALHAGIPYSPLAPAYSLRSTDYHRLRHIAELLTPGLVFVQHGKAYERALKAVLPGVPVVAVDDLVPGQVPFSGLMDAPAGPVVEEAFEKISPGTIAKVLFTSGSTGLSKGVINTHGNITANWQQITQTFPFMADGGLVLIDWLPWNHTFGGNHNFGLTLFNGGSLYIDGGNPTPDGIRQTLRNLRDIAPTVYFNVPKGFEELIPHLKRDEALCRHFFSRLNMFFYAGAGMAQHVWDELEELAYASTGRRLLIGTGLGMTEASPSCLFNVCFGSYAGVIGTPVPGLEVKLAPEGDKLEARFRAPNIFPGYWRNPEASANAFDEEGFYRTGDALKFADPANPNAGMLFDGRIAEDFKMGTGTWVNVGVLKAKLIAAGKGLIQEAVITGHDRPFLGAIILPELNHCRRLAGLGEEAAQADVIRAPAVRAALQAVLDEFAGQSTGSSTLIRRAVFAGFALSMDQGEITDKGSINQRRILANHAEVVEMIYEEEARGEVLQVKG